MIINKAPEAVKRFCEEMFTIINENKDKRSKTMGIAEDFTSELRDRKEDKPMTIEERLQKEEDLAKEIAKAFVETVKTFDWSTIEIGVINKFLFRLEPAETRRFMEVVLEKCGFHNLTTTDFINDPLYSRIERAFWMLTNMPDYKEAYLKNYVTKYEKDEERDAPYYCDWTLVFSLLDNK